MCTTTTTTSGQARHRYNDATKNTNFLRQVNTQIYDGPVS